VLIKVRTPLSQCEKSDVLLTLWSVVFVNQEVGTGLEGAVGRETQSKWPDNSGNRIWRTLTEGKRRTAAQLCFCVATSYANEREFKRHSLPPEKQKRKKEKKTK
jgi:hypothetical protein